MDTQPFEIRRATIGTETSIAKFDKTTDDI
jgi:hypothetical protein